MTSPISFKYAAIFVVSFIFFYLIFISSGIADSKILVFFGAFALTGAMYWNDQQRIKDKRHDLDRIKARVAEQKQKEDKERLAHYGDVSETPGWGYLVVEFENPGIWRSNTATARNIIDALGSNHKLPTGKEKQTPEIQEKRKQYYDTIDDLIKTYHFDGHLAIGGNLFWDGQGHMITIGGARVGFKGSSLVLPALLGVPNRLPGSQSYIVLDPKGENLAVSGSYLKKCGYNVICINPFNISEVAEFGQASFNIFETFDADSPDFDKYADMIANSIVAPSKNSNSHFDKTSRSLISLYIRHLMTQDDEPKSFRTLYKWLRLGGEDRLNFLQHKMGRNMAFDTDIANEAFAIFSQIKSGANEEVESTYSTIRAATDSFKSAPLREALSKSDFDITKVAKEKTAIFVCMNPSDLEDNPAFMRILFGSFIRSLTRNYSKTRKVVMIMDEFPTMGHFKEFEIMSGFMAGYNVTLWPIMQDLTQLKDLYPGKWETFVNNAMIRHFSGIGDNFTADYVSHRMPNVNKGNEEKPRQEPLMRPDEVQGCKYIITFISGVQKPALFEKKPYWEIPDVRNNASPNPFR